MAIKYLNSNIIKIYYGGNEIKQAYLNGDYFFPLSSMGVEFEEGIITAQSGQITKTFSFDPVAIEIWLPNESGENYSFIIHMFNEVLMYSNYGFSVDITSSDSWNGVEGNQLVGNQFSLTTNQSDGTNLYYRAWGKTEISGQTKKYASGTFESSGGTVSGLGFSPQFIKVCSPYDSSNTLAYTYSINSTPIHDDATNRMSGFFAAANGWYGNIYNSGDTSYGTNIFTVSDDGFSFYNDGGGTDTFTWEVWGE